MNLRQALIGAASLIALTVPAVAAETVKIAFIDPLSGGGATTGENGLKHYQYLAEYLNGKQSGYKFEITGYDNKTNPQESLVAGAEGDRRRRAHHHAGQRLLGCRRADRFRAEIQRPQSRQGNPLSQLRRGRSGADQREVQLLAFPLGRQFRHQDGGADELHEERARTSRSST